MGILIDFLVLSVVVFFIILSVKKGFVLTVLDLLSYIISLVAASLLSKYLAKLIFDLFIKDPMTTRVQEGLTAAANQTAAEQVTAVMQKIPLFILDVWGDSTAKISETINAQGATAAAAVTEKIIAPAVNALIGAVLFAVLFFAVLFFTKWISRLIAKTFKLPMIRQLNMFLGGVLGVIKGSIVALCLLAVFSLINPSFHIIQAATLEQTYITKHVIKHNPIARTISNIFD